MANKKLTIVSLAIIFFFALSLVNPPVEDVISSQTRGVKPNVSFASYANPLAISQTYTYGSSSSGSYLSTRYKDGTYHVSDPSTYASSTLSTSNTYPAYGWNDAGSGTVAWSSTTNIYTVNSAYATATCTGGTNVLSQWLDSSHYGFSLPAGSTIKGFKVFVYGHCTIAGDEFKQIGFQMIKAGARTGSGNGSFSFIATDAWYSAGGPTSLFGTTWSQADVESADFGVGLQGKFYTYTYTAYVDAFYIIVYYTALYYRTNYYYEFWYVSSPRFNVTGLGWRFYGYSDAPSGVSIYQWNWITSSWIDSGLDIPSSNGWQNASALTINSYMNATGFMRLAFDKSGLSSSFKIFVDYVYWNVNYSSVIVQETSYVTAMSEPVYTNGSTYSGTYRNTETSDDSYQISSGGQYYTYGSQKDKNPSAGSERDWTGYGSVNWNGETNIYSDDTSYATATRGSGSYLKYTHWLVASSFGFSIPSGAEILAISSGYKGYSDYKTSYIHVSIQKWQLGITTTDTCTADIGSSGYWETSETWYYSNNGTFGHSWTSSEINGAGFSVHMALALVNSYDIGQSYPTAYVDVITISVWYRQTFFRAKFEYTFRFTASDTTTIQSINWLVEGKKTQAEAATIYIYNYETLGWDSAGTLGTTESSQNSTVDESKYISLSGYMKIRFDQTGCSSQNYIYIDKMMWTIVYLVTPEDNTPPQSPELFYPSPNQQIMYDNPLFCWNDSIDASGIEYYRIAVSQYPDFSDILFNETTTKTWYKHYEVIPCSMFYWKVKAVDKSGNIGEYSGSRVFYATSDPEVYLSAYDLDGEGVLFNSVKWFINGSRITNPYVAYPGMNVYINLTVTDYFDNVLYQGCWNITYTPFYIDVQLQLVSVTLKAYDLSVVDVTSGSMTKTLSFYDSVITKLKPGTYTFNGTAWDGAISFSVSKQITLTTNRGITLAVDPHSTIYVVYVNQNDPNLSSLDPANFRTKYYLASQGKWLWLNPYAPELTMLTVEKVNITVYDRLGSTVVDNQQYAYNQTIEVPVTVIQVKVKSYGDNAFGAAILHRAGTAAGGGQVLLGVSDIDIWYVYPGSYRLDVYYSFVVANGRVVPLQLWINQTYDITPANYPLYCAGFLVANASTKNIIDILNDVPSSLTTISVQLSPGGEVFNNVAAAVGKLGNLEKDTNIFTGGSMTIVGVLAAIIPFMTFLGKIVTHFQPSPDPDQIADAKARKIARKMVNDYISGGHGPTVTPDSTGTSTHVGPYPVKPRPARARR